MRNFFFGFLMLQTSRLLWFQLCCFCWKMWIGGRAEGRHDACDSSSYLRVVADGCSWCQLEEDICIKIEAKKTFSFYFQYACLLTQCYQTSVRTRSAKVKQGIPGRQTILIHCSDIIIMSHWNLWNANPALLEAGANTKQLFSFTCNLNRS